ncbi:MAG TPA: ATP-binding protein [Steroidobacteraceae bacterium]|nr:ATP-binding protein [Steroidobacteraceae bacterium]
MNASPEGAEAHRLAALSSYNVLDTPPEEDLNDLVRLAAQICGTPIAMISLVDAQRQWCKAAFGVDLQQIEREHSFCTHAIRRAGVYVVPDTKQDAAFVDNPMVVGEPRIRFYAGAPLLTPDGAALGTLCVLDRQPRRLIPDQTRALTLLSRHVMAQFELRRQTRERSRMNHALLSLLEDERQAQAAVRESEVLNRAVLDSMLAHIAVLDRNGKLLAVNAAWRRFARENADPRSAALGGTDLGTNYLEACRPAVADGDEYATRVYTQLGALLRGERGSFTLEYPCHSGDRPRWFLLGATPLGTKQGGAVVSHVDITERKQAEDLLRVSNERFEMLARATNDAVRDWDLTGDTVWWNEGFETLFGLRRTEVASPIDAWSERIHPDDRARVLGGVRQAIDAGAHSWTDRYRIARRDGSYAHVADRGQVVRDGAGKPIRMLAGMNDITEWVALEEQLRQSHRLEAIGQLTGGVAHDFNNLLTVIMGNAELIREGSGLPGPLRESATVIVEAARSAAELTKRLLAFARKQALNPSAVDPNGLISAMHGLLRRTLGAHIDIQFASVARPWLALVDAAQLENAVLNLCINSRDAMAGGGRLMIETANARIDEEYAARHIDVKAGEYVMITVTDSGCGIPPQLLPHVFEPFFTTKDKSGGTGLGLAMVYGFIKQSGGHIGIYSEAGEGTAVKMYLPRAAEAGMPAAAVTGTFPALRGSETILLVEDNAQVRRFALDQLERVGYEVLQAANGVEALEILARRDDVHLLFTDVVMPGGLSGRQLADEALARRPDLKVLFTSGYTEDAILHQGRLDPGVQLLSKPYRRNELTSRIRAILDAP